MKKLYLILAILFFSSLIAYAGPHTSGGIGTISGIGDCTSGACLDGSSDGGTYIRLYDGNSHYTALYAGDSSGNLSFYFPTSAGAQGQVLYFSGANQMAALAVGTQYQFLMTNGAGVSPSWSAYTMPSSIVAGDILYGSGTNAVSGLTKGANNSILGVNGSGTLGYYTTHQHDDSAAQFVSATASKGSLKWVQTGISDTKTVTRKDTADQSVTIETDVTALSADSKTVKLTFACTDTCTMTTPAASQTLASLAGTETFTNKTLTAPYITAPEVFIDCNGSADPYAYCTSANASTLTAALVSRTIINSYGRGEAQTVTLPTAAAGMTFIAIVGTQHNSKWEFAPGGGSTLYLEVSSAPHAVAAISETNEAVGSRMSCATFKTGASAWSWMCGGISGTWDHTDL